MKTYTGTEEIHANPMTRAAYNELRGWTVPSDENPQDEGYIIERRQAGHVSWMPKDVFESTYSEVNDQHAEMVNFKHDLCTTKYTSVVHEKNFQYNAPHLFQVYSWNDPNGSTMLGQIHFQEGPIKEAGVNGVSNEDLIAMVICRLEHFNRSEFSCRDNAVAITKLEESLMWLRKRTIGRENRGVEGTSIK